jgi:hypothetical protein
LRVAALIALVACNGGEGDPAGGPPRAAAPAFAPAPAVLRRLTTDQYLNSVRDLFGESAVLPTALEPDLEVDGLFAEGSALAGVSALGVEQYEDAAYDLAVQLSDPAIHARLVPCEAADGRDDNCAAQALAVFGRRAWRRPVSDAELDLLVTLAGASSDTLGTFDAGLQFAIAAVLQSPAFLYRVETGEPDPSDPARQRYTSWEMASRLSYFLLNTMPDDALLDAAEAGDLTEDAGLAAQVDRLLADPRARPGVRAIFSDVLGLAELDDVAKDPLIYLQWSADLPVSAREETLAGIEDLVFDQDADWRELMVSRRTFVDRRLAQLYAVAAPTSEGFAPVELPEDGGRRGFLGQASFLVLQSHPTTTSVTRRGLYIRERLLCQAMPDPPAGLNTSIPEPSDDAPTMRDRVDVHLSVEECAACHQLLDPIGLGLENFDGVGAWRATENGVSIDPSGDLDGSPFADAWELAQVVHDHRDLAPCLVQRLFEVATGRRPTDAEEDLLSWHADGFAGEGYRVTWLLRDLVLSPGFRTLAPEVP